MADNVASHTRAKALEARVEALESSVAAIKAEVEALAGLPQQMEQLSTLPKQIEQILTLLNGQTAASDRQTVPSVPILAGDEKNFPSTAKMPMQMEDNQLFARLDPTKVPKFNGASSPMELVRWLLSLPSWVADLGLASNDDLFSGTVPVIRKFLGETMLSWFTARQGGITSYATFFDAICKRVVRYNYRPTLEQIYAERVMQLNEGPQAYIYDKTRLASVCFFGRADATGTQQIADDGVIHGLLPQYRPFAMILLEIDPLLPIDQLAEKLSRLELGPDRLMTREDKEVRQPRQTTPVNNQMICFNCGNPLHKTLSCPVPCPHCKRPRHSWSKCSSNPRASEYLKIRRSELNAVGVEYDIEEQEEEELPFAAIHLPAAKKDPDALPITCLIASMNQRSYWEQGDLLIELYVPRVDRPLLALFDSGARVSVLSEDFGKGATMIEVPPPLLKSASGDRMILSGVCQELFFIAGRTFNHQFIIGNIPFDAILGKDFQRNHGLHVDWVKSGIRSQKDWDFFVPIIHSPHSSSSIALLTGNPDAVEENPNEIEDQLFYERSVQQIPLEAIISGDLNPRDRASLLAVLSKFASEFTRTQGRFKTAQFTIELVGSKRPTSSPRRVSPPRQAHITKHLQEMLEDGIVVPSRSPFSSPVTLTPKSDGAYRFCIDYRVLNAITKKDAYPLPNQDDLLAALSRYRYFAKLDLKSGYWQIPIAPEDREKTAFVTQEGLFEFTVMPFGLCNAPAAFQRAMNAALAGLLNRVCFCYMDDLLIGGRMVEELAENLYLVLKRLLKEEGLAVNLKKCLVGFTRLPFLGHIVSADGLEPDPKKVQAVHGFPAPKNVWELRRFLGLAGYYRKFIPNMSSISRPLELLLRKDQLWTWTAIHQKAFEDLKSALAVSTLLSRPDYSLPFEIQTDASNVGLGAVLIQRGPDGEKPLSFISRALSPAEGNYHAREKECLAIKWALRKFAPFVEGCSDLTVATDHESLKWLMTQDKPTGRLARWVLELQATPFKIVHRAGSLNVVADTLSRAVYDAPLCLMIPSEWTERLKTLQQSEEWIKEEIESGKACWEEGIACKKITIGPVERTVVLVPEALRKEAVEQVHIGAGHFGINGTYELIRRRYFWPGTRRFVRAVLSACQVCAVGKQRMGKAPGLMGHRQATRFNECVFLDLIGPLIRAPGGKEYVLIMVDGFTRWPELVALASTTSNRTVQVFDEAWCCRYGHPETVVTDNGPQFSGAAFGEFCLTKGSKHGLIAPYHPQANLAERIIRDVKQCLRILIAESGHTWAALLPHVSFSLRCKVNASTGFSPSELLLGLSLRLPSDPASIVHDSDPMDTLAAAIPSARDNDAKAIARRCQRYNAYRRDWSPKIGDLVFVSNDRRRHTLEPIRRGPFRVANKMSPLTYQVVEPVTGQALVRNVHHLVPFGEEMV